MIRDGAATEAPSTPPPPAPTPTSAATNVRSRPRRRMPRAVARTPLLLYRAGLGGLLARRFLMLEHTGRRTGARRSAVLEVIEHDANAVVMSGFGRRSNWLQNVTSTPACVVNIGRARRHARAEVLAPGDGALVLGRFRRDHRRAFGAICRLWGLDADDPTSTVALAELAPVVVFHLGEVAPVELLRREFEVDAPRDDVWEVLADVASWPDWARHIRSVEVEPSGPVAASTTGRFRLVGGLRSRFDMCRFDPPRRWEWTSRLATLTVHYDHRFEVVAPGRTRLIWVVGGTGFGRGTLGRLFARPYGRRLDRAIPRFQAYVGGAPVPHEEQVGP